MAASQANPSSSSSSFAFDTAFPPLPTRPPTPPLPDPPPDVVNSSSANPSDANLRSNLSDPRNPPFRSTPSNVSPPQSSCSNVNLTIPNQSANHSSSNASFPAFTKLDYASLFNSLPRNAGVFQPQHFDIPREGKPKIPETVRSEGLKYWSDFLVGFFLDGTSSYHAVVNFLNRYWKLDGEVSIKSDGIQFYFKFSNESDRERILKSDPIFIRGRMFIITRWDPSIGNSQAQIRKVPIWVHFYRIPTILWTLLGINWLACHVGRLICFDSSTERLQRFRYAKALIEISSDFELPDKIVIDELGKDCPPVRITYDWRPNICTTCKVFGHSTKKCEFNSKADEDVSHVEDFENNHRKHHDQTREFNRKGAANAKNNNWTSVNSKAKKYWKSKGVTNDKANVNVANEVSNVNANPFNALVNEHDGNDVTEAAIDEVNPKQNIGGIADHGNDANTDFEAQANTSQETADHNMEQINQDVEMENMIGNLVDGNSDNGNKSAKGDSSLSNFVASGGSLSTSPVNAITSNTSPIVAKSCSSASLTSTPSKSSPYVNLKPPSNVQLPPPMVSGSGLTFPGINPALLSTATPKSSFPSSKSKNYKLKGKFWADDDLDEGIDYGPEDVMPLSGKLKTTRRHTRNNPMYDPSIA